MQNSPAEILANAARLKSSPSAANMANYSSIFDGPAEGHVPSAWEQFSGDANADRAETALGAGPSIDALRNALDEQRLQHRTDLQFADADFNEHGLERGLAHANVQNQVGDVLSEGAAHRSFLPWASSAGDRDAERALTQADIRYGQPARIQAAGNVAAHQADASGRVGAAQARDASLPTRALYDALNSMIARGKMPTPEEIAELKNTFGVQ